MIRTQVRLSKGEYAAAAREARRLGISVAELLRRSLLEVLGTESTERWMRYAGMIASGDSHASQRIDDVLYGNRRRR